MGVIQRQTIKSSFYIYLGILIGFVNVSILYPQFLTTTQIGVITLIVSWGAIFAQFGTLGFGGAVIRFFPFFRDQTKKHNGFFFLLMIVFLIGSLVVSLMIWLLRDWLANQAEQGSLFVEYLHLLTPYTLAMLLFMLLDVYNRSLYNASTGLLLNETIARVLVTIVIIPFALSLFSFDNYIGFYVLTRFIIVALFIVFLLWKKSISLQPDFRLLDTDMWKQMASISMYSLLTGFSAIAVMRLDAIMIGNIMSESDVGIYITCFFYGTLVSLPSRAIKGITPTLISDAFKSNDLGTIADIYRKSSVNQTVAGAFLLIGIWANIHNVFEILEPEYLPGMYVILYIGMMNLVKMVTGNNDIIIGYSQYYRVNTYFMFVWLALIGLTNWILIPERGIVGAAIASLISVAIICLVRAWFLYYKFGFQPFGKGHIIILAIACMCYAVITFVPIIAPFYLDILVRGLMISILFVPAILISRVAPEINSIVNSYFEKLKGR